MSELLLILVATVLANNYVLAQFLGLCPFFGVSGQQDAALGMAFATAFVLTMAAAVSYLVEHWLLIPLGLGYLRTLSFILIIATLVQVTDIVMRRTSPVLTQALGIYLPLITTNCAVLGVALLNARASDSLLASIFYGFGTAVGFGLVLWLFAALRDRCTESELPIALRGSAITLVTAGIMSMAFMGFTGLDRLLK